MLKVPLVQQDQQDFKETLDMPVHRVLKVLLDHRVQQGQPGLLVLEERQVQLDQQVPKVRLDQSVPQVV